MLKLQELAPPKKGIYRWQENGNPDNVVEIPYEYKILTSALQRQISEIGTKELAEFRRERNKAEEKKEIAEFLPRDIAVLQLTKVLISMDVEIKKGQRLDPTDYEQLSELPVPVLEGLYETLLGDMYPKKASSTDSTTTTSETESEQELVIG